MNDIQRKNIADYKRQLEATGSYLPEEITEMVNEKIAEAEHLNTLLGGTK